MFFLLIWLNERRIFSFFVSFFLFDESLAAAATHAGRAGVLLMESRVFIEGGHALMSFLQQKALSECVPVSSPPLYALYLQPIRNHFSLDKATGSQEAEGAAGDWHA